MAAAQQLMLSLFKRGLKNNTLKKHQNSMSEEFCVKLTCILSGSTGSSPGIQNCSKWVRIDHINIISYFFLLCYLTSRYRCALSAYGQRQSVLHTWFSEFLWMFLYWFYMNSNVKIYSLTIEFNFFDNILPGNKISSSTVYSVYLIFFQLTSARTVPLQPQ